MGLETSPHRGNESARAHLLGTKLHNGEFRRVACTTMDVGPTPQKERKRESARERERERTRERDDDDVFYLLLQKQKIALGHIPFGYSPPGIKRRI